MKIFRTNVSFTTVFFNIDNEKYELIFDRDIFGNIKDVEICRHNLEKTPVEFKKAKVTSVTPKNILGRIKMIWFAIYDEVMYRLKSKFRHQ